MINKDIAEKIKLYISVNDFLTDRRAVTDQWLDNYILTNYKDDCVIEMVKDDFITYRINPDHIFIKDFVSFGNGLKLWENVLAKATTLGLPVRGMVNFNNQQLINIALKRYNFEIIGATNTQFILEKEGINMGGSSGGGGGYSTGMSRSEKQNIEDQRNALSQQSSYLGTQAGYYGQIGQMGNSADVNMLAGSGLTNAEQQQLQTIDVGQQRAQQTITQNTREQSSARGLFSSAGAIGQEAAGLANLDVQRSQNIADIYGNAQQRQFQGLGLKSGLLGQAGAGYGTVAGGFGNVARGYGNIVGQYQNSQQISNQGQQTQDQYNLGQQQQTRNNVIGGARLMAAPFTGGMSLMGGW